MAQPLYRLTISRKDKEEIRFRDYKGKSRTGKHMPIGAIFQGEDGRLFISAKEPFKYSPDEHWMNIFAVEPKEDSDDEAPKSKKPAGKKPAGKGKASKKQEDDEDDPFGDD